MTSDALARGRFCESADRAYLPTARGGRVSAVQHLPAGNPCRCRDPVGFGLIRVSILCAAISEAGGTVRPALRLDLRLARPGATGTDCDLGWIEIAEQVSSGEIAVDVARPVDMQPAGWARDFGRASFQLLSRGLPPLLIGAVEEADTSQGPSVRATEGALWRGDQATVAVSSGMSSHAAR